MRQILTNAHWKYNGQLGATHLIKTNEATVQIIRQSWNTGEAADLLLGKYFNGKKSLTKLLQGAADH